jgi:hypothetical protein
MYGECVRVQRKAHYEQTVGELVARLGRRIRRVCTGRPLHYEQSGNQWPGQEGEIGKCVQVYRYTGAL